MTDDEFPYRNQLTDYRTARRRSLDRRIKLVVYAAGIVATLIWAVVFGRR